jgi:hypothetical protein
MSDISGAAAPATDTPSSLGVPSFAETANERLTSLKRDPEWTSKWAQGSASHRNELKSLLTLAHGGLSEADQTALATSIKLERTPSIAAGEKARAAAETAAAASMPVLPFQLASKLTPEQANDLRTDIGSWANGLNLPPSTQRVVLDRISSEGGKVSAMSPEDRAAWVQRQNTMLDRAAGSKEKADAWRADAARASVESDRARLRR